MVFFMLIILSPSKRKKFSDKIMMDPFLKKYLDQPKWISKAGKIADIMRSYSPSELAEVLKVSDTIAIKEAGYFEEWNVKAVQPETQPGVFSYDGDVYRALNARDMTEKEWAWLNDHLRILSALYGISKPFDLIQPYRLEFHSTKVRPDGMSLYDYWQKPIMDSINDELEKMDDPVLVNLASEEFSKAVDVKKLKGKMITPVFQEMREGGAKVIGLYAKKARGLMTRYAAKNGIDDVERLKAFDTGGYAFHEKTSTDSVWVFRR